MAQATFTIERESQVVQTFTEDLGNGILLDIVLIPPGQFLMGSPHNELERQPSEGPQHLVTIQQPFFMGQYQVTQAQWEQVAKMKQVKRKLKAKPSHFNGNNLPVEQISWLDAEEFCLRLSAHTKRNYRLPSEAEWEYACRAGTTTPFHFGETIDAKLANYQAQDQKSLRWSGKYGRGVLGEYRAKTTPVGTFPANNFGLYDMHGNVWEWCLDHWHDNYQGAPTDGSAWIDPAAGENAHRILRGGSWFSAPWWCRSAFRVRDSADYRNNFFGFRVVYSRARTSS
ncbi:MAG: formylglycine-generating enzyme family protein [Synechococcales bacterium]|nr:formylglycine-generating enzyme family protein [Synechococcales bacterium]